MALANSSDGLWLNKSNNTTFAVREFTVTKNLAGNSDATVLRITQNSNPGNYRYLTVWGRVFCERTDGTANWASMNQFKGVALWGGDINSWTNRYNDTYGGSHMNFLVYAHMAINSSSQVDFRSHVFGPPSWTNTVVYNLVVLYNAWDLVTVTFP